MMESKKLLTVGIKNSLPLELTMLLWNLHQNKKDRDYLTVFEFKKENGILIAEHRQEEPEYSKKYEIKIDIEEPETIFIVDNVIDKIEISTMMFASEY